MTHTPSGRGQSHNLLFLKFGAASMSAQAMHLEFYTQIDYVDPVITFG